MGGEDVQDQRRPVDHLHPDPILQVAKLGRLELAIADDGIRAGGDDDLSYLIHLAASDESGRVGAASALHETCLLYTSRCV